jgi:serine/threonine protein kinase
MLGEFEIIDLVGEGGFGIVYLAQDHSLHRKVALKEYMPALLASRGKDASVAVRSERQRENLRHRPAQLRQRSADARPVRPPGADQGVPLLGGHGTAYMVMPFLSG